MNLNQLEYFVKVARAGSLSRAAAGMGLSQPTLSRQIRLLEEDVGDRLLHRTGRGVALTPAGSCLLAHADTILAEVRAAREHLRELKSVPAGPVRVGITASLAKSVTPELVKRVLEQFPGCSLTVMDGLSAQVREWLLEGKIDLAVLYSAEDATKLHWETLMREELVLACGMQARASLPQAVAFRELAGFPLVLPSAPNPIRALLEAQCRRHGVTLTVVAEVNAIDSLVATAASSNCLTILPRSRAIEDAGAGKLAFAGIHSPRVLNRLCLATRATAPDSAVVVAVKQILRAMFAATPAVAGLAA
ncbi:MAG TPA: LysR family transcriptional regulator [Ramlibacter sp.]|jgi:LysR family nitrogen assimilation transcriptional regulator|nr:LysR family transcriptional regulator [Ramlibacter sp.]